MHKGESPHGIFPTFFCVKEGLAFIYETFQMYEEALMQYDELEALFSAYEGMFPFGGDQPGDDSGQIFKSNRKPYRQMITSRTISEFDFRQYVFTRQAKLLFARSLPVMVAERGLRFIRGLEKDMVKNGKIKTVYIWAWAFGAYMDLAESCKPYAHIKVDPQKITKERRKMQKKDKQQLNLLLADIYLNASLLLQRIGIDLKFLPKDDGDYLFSSQPHVPFIAFQGYGGACDNGSALDVFSSDEESELPVQNAKFSPEAAFRQNGDGKPSDIPTLNIIAPSNSETPNSSAEKSPASSPKQPGSPRLSRTIPAEKYEFTFKSLYQAVQSIANFDYLYKAITKKSVRSYNSGHRQRSVNWLQYTLATMHFHRGTPSSYQECMNLLSMVVKSHSMNNSNEASAWPPLLFAAFNKLCECYRRAQHHEDYVDTLLHLLLYKELAPGPEYWQYYFSELLRVIYDPVLLPNLLAKEHLLSIIQIDLNIPQQTEVSTPSEFRTHLTHRTREFPLDAVVDIECTLSNKLPNELNINYLCLQMIILPEETSGSSDDEEAEPEIPPDRRLILERHELVLKPSATTKILLQLKPHQIGTFVCNKMWIQIGNLLLTRSIPDVMAREKKAAINVVPSTGTLELSVVQPPAMLLAQHQSILIQIRTKNDTVTQATLEITKPVIPTNSRSGKSLHFCKSPTGEKKSKWKW